MSNEAVEVLIVGGGQAGLAMSEHLSACDVSHLVLERQRIAERWRSERWDSLVANGPAWHDRFPGLEFDLDPDGFASKEQVVEYFETYARQIDAPIRCGVEVLSVSKNVGRAGFRAETSDGPIEARYVVAATGAFQQPLIPPVLPEDAKVTQIHSSGYRNPGQLPDGAVLVVGAGSSGVQIADELRSAGRSVYLCVGPHDRPPRSYRGRDFCWWLGVLNKWDAEAPPEGAAHVTIAVSGAHGGRTVDFRDLERSGITLLGFMTSYDQGTLRFAPDLAENIAQGDANYLALLDEADAYVAGSGLDLPEELEAHDLGPLPDKALDPVGELDLTSAGVTSVVWATGFTSDYSWLQVDAFDENGKPDHRRGVSSEPGVYFLGLPWQSRRGSTFIWGVWHDAKHVADHIATQNGYLAYQSPKAGVSA
jgi:putative flavoprotein involved in K+ transport